MRYALHVSAWAEPMAHVCWLVLSELLLQALLTSRDPDGGLRVAPTHGSLTRGDRAYVGWLSVTGIWGLHTFSPRALAREALSMASAGAAGSVLLRQSRGKRPSRWRVITPGARRGTDTPGRVRPSHCSGAAGANSNHSC